jgi:hypothetical protein
MVSGILTVVTALVGAFVGGIAAQKTAEYRQKKPDYREYGNHMLRSKLRRLRT